MFVVAVVQKIEDRDLPVVVQRIEDRDLPVVVQSIEDRDLPGLILHYLLNSERVLHQTVISSVGSLAIILNTMY